MTLKLFNSFGNTLEAFKPIKGKNVGYYTCGPTVYNFAHIGNMRAYVWEDLLKRYLTYRGYTVKHVMNFTDVDDKTIKGSITENTTLYEYTAKYKKAFLEDIAKLNILPADTYTAATDYINDMVKLIQTLLDKGIAYRADDGNIYYSIKKFPAYGKLAGIDTKKLKAGARISQDEYEKEGVGDFALWKAWDENDGTVFWETPLGKGRPGWHIECSAMSIKELGSTFDIHVGGMDNKFPHHENEIAQSEGATGKKFAHYWLHCAHLMVEDKKMAKSTGNFFTLRDILAKGYNPLAVRYLLLNAHYRQPVNFTFDSLKDAEKTLIGIQNSIIRLKETTKTTDGASDAEIENHIKNAREGFIAGMDNDLAVPEALKYLFECIREVNRRIDENAISKKEAERVLAFLKELNTVLGVLTFENTFFELTDAQQKLIDERTTARKEKNFKRSDELRDELKKLGVEVVDNKDGTTTTRALSQ